MILRQGSAGTSQSLSDRREKRRQRKEGWMEEEREIENRGKEIGYAEIQPGNLRISIALLINIFDTQAGEGEK